MISLDECLERWIVEHRVDWLDPLFVVLTYAGTHGLLWIALAIAAAIWLSRPSIAFAMPAVVLLSDLAASGLKAATDRRRPEEALDGIDVLVTTLRLRPFPRVTPQRALRPRLCSPLRSPRSPLRSSCSPRP